jgi:hypothetical protein
MHTTTEDMPKARITRAQAAEHLSRHGYPISARTLMNFAVKGEGPSIVGYWGRRALYHPAECLTWAEARVRPVHHANRARVSDTAAKPLRATDQAAV